MLILDDMVVKIDAGLRPGRYRRNVYPTGDSFSPVTLDQPEIDDRIGPGRLTVRSSF
jgi:hypothetical protein